MFKEALTINSRYIFYMEGGLRIEGIVNSVSDYIHITNLAGAKVMICKLDQIIVIELVEDINKNFKIVPNVINKPAQLNLNHINEESAKLAANLNEENSKTLIELQKEKIQIEKEIVSSKLKEHTISGIRKIKYANQIDFAKSKS